MDYVSEISDSRTIRNYEWQGITEIIESLVGDLQGLRWLDYGAGLGGLVRYARERGADAFGLDDGFASEWMKSSEIPSLGEEEIRRTGVKFQVITAIEVIEHISDPVGFLRAAAEFLEPGGVIFLTTGNAKPYRGRISKWDYVRPDLHIGFFEPSTLAVAMETAGLLPEYHGAVPGFEPVIRYKVLKTLRVRRQSIIEWLLPWGVIAKVVDRKFGVSAHPIGRSPVEG